MTDKTKAELIAEAEGLGVDVATSWTKDRLEVEIVKARPTGPAPVEQIAPVDDRLRRFTALDSAEKLGVAVGDEWTTDQIEQAVDVIRQAASVAPPAARSSNGYDEFPDGAASPRG